MDCFVHVLIKLKNSKVRIYIFKVISYCTVLYYLYCTIILCIVLLLQNVVLLAYLYNYIAKFACLWNTTGKIVRNGRNSKTKIIVWKSGNHDGSFSSMPFSWCLRTSTTQEFIIHSTNIVIKWPTATIKRKTPSQHTEHTIYYF